MSASSPSPHPCTSPPSPFTPCPQALTAAQLTCTGKYCTHAPATVQCTQAGHDGLSPQWKCEAELPSSLTFGPLEVVCEGWSKAGDTNVLAGSCALEYELVPSYLDGDVRVYGEGGESCRARRFLLCRLLV